MSQCLSIEIELYLFLIIVFYRYLFLLFRFSYILKETPQALKKKYYPLSFECKSDILNKYLIASSRTDVCSKLQRMYEDGSDLQKIREQMNMEYFSIKFECSLGKSYQMFHRCATLKTQSILIMDQLLNVLLHKFGFSVSKVIIFMFTF